MSVFYYYYYSHHSIFYNVSSIFDIKYDILNNVLYETYNMKKGNEYRKSSF